MFQPMIDNMRISNFAKAYKNTNNTVNNGYMHMMVNIAGMPYDITNWSKTDLTGKTPLVKQIIRVPSMMSDFLPSDVQGKEYAVIDMRKEVNGNLDMSKLTAQINKLSSSITNTIASFNSGLLPIKYRGKGTFKTLAGKTINVHNYTIKLNDTTFKLLMKHLVNNLAKDKDVIADLKEYMIVANTNTSNDNESKEISKQIDGQTSNFIKEFNNSMEGLKNTKIVGKKGIVINYSVNEQGYIVNANGVIDLMVKASMLSQRDNATRSGKLRVYITLL
jgi:hypothetical protein